MTQENFDMAMFLTKGKNRKYVYICVLVTGSEEFFIFVYVWLISFFEKS